MTVPLLGLTATAYRGHNEVETERLVRRYGSNKLDDGVFGDDDPYHYLQHAACSPRCSRRCSPVWTSPGPRSCESTSDSSARCLVMSRTRSGQNFERNQVILESITSQPDDWTVLLFASSVDHARAMAAELSYYGVPAATDLRRHRPGASASLHRAVPGSRDSRAHELQRADPGLRRARGPSRLRHSARRSARTCTSR